MTASILPGGLCGTDLRPQGSWGTGPRKAAGPAAWLRGATNTAREPCRRFDLRAWPELGTGSTQPQPGRGSPAAQMAARASGPRPPALDTAGTE